MDVGDPTSCHSAMNGSNNLCHGFRFFRHTLIANWNALVSRNNVRCPGFLCYLSFCASRFKLVVAGRRKLRVSISCYFRSQTSLLALLVMAPCPVVKPKRNLRNMVPESAGSPRRKLKILAAGSHLETCTAAVGVVEPEIRRSRSFGPMHPESGGCIQTPPGRFWYA